MNYNYSIKKSPTNMSQRIQDYRDRNKFQMLLAHENMSCVNTWEMWTYPQNYKCLISWPCVYILKCFSLVIIH